MSQIPIYELGVTIDIILVLDNIYSTLKYIPNISQLQIYSDVMQFKKIINEFKKPRYHPYQRSKKNLTYSEKKLLHEASVRISHLSKYTFSGIIGSGSFGLVCKATSTTGKVVAIKIQTGVLELEEKFILNKIQSNCDRFLCINEIIIVGSELTFIVMEYIPYESLDYDKIQSLDIITRKNIMKYLYKSIKILHSLNVAHKDIKPDNIIFTGTRVKLIDYGLSCASQQCNWGGTINYIHPYLRTRYTFYDPIELWKENDFYSLYIIGIIDFGIDSDELVKLKNKFKTLNYLV
ncbi:MAG: protein kinase [Candidatus Shapirobacteria bacterium]|nr:protein kinase [Candidatus Shapirobacteria bacterium]